MTVGVSLVVGGRGWVMAGVVGCCLVMCGVVGCCLVMCGVVGHSEEEVAVAVEC